MSAPGSAAAAFAAINRQAARENMTYGACRHSKAERQLAILAVLRYLARVNGKRYSFPSQEKLCDLLWTVHRVSMSRRTLNRDLRELEDAGAIERIKRHQRDRRNPSAGLQFRSTAYYILQAVRRWSSAIRKRLEILGFGRVPNLAQHGTLLQRENDHRAVPARPTNQQVAPPGQLRTSYA